MAFKPIDPKRDEFRRYLERSGVIEALTKVFVRLVTERPENPMEFLQSKLGDSKLQSDHEAYVRKELEEARAEIQLLRQRILAIDPTALDDEKVAPEEATSESLENSASTELEAKEYDDRRKELAEEESTVENEHKNIAVNNSEVNGIEKQRREEHLEENMEVPGDECGSAGSNVKESANLSSDKSVEKANE